MWLLRIEVSLNHTAMFGAEMEIEPSFLELVHTYQAIRRHNRNTTNIISSEMDVVNSSSCNQI